MPYPPQGAAPADIAASVWAYAARRLTNLDDIRAARIDNLDALLSTRLSKTDFDALIGTRWDTPDLETVCAAINAQGWIQWEVSEITLTGVEQDLLHASQACIYPLEDPSWSAWNNLQIDAYVDLTPMEAGDTVVLSEYAAILGTPLTYRLYASHTYNDAQTEPLVRFTKKMSHVAWRVRGQQTATGAGGFKEVRSVAYIKRIY